MSHQGSCHCGQIRFEVQGEFDKVMECNCSHCSRKGYLLWFVPRGQFTLQTPESALATYTFNRHAIRHHFCPTCGCAPFAFGAMPDGSPTVAVNVRCLEEIDLANLKREFVNGKAF